MRLNKGVSAAVQPPTWSAKVDRLSRHALLGIALGLPVERLMLAKLLEQDHRQKAGTGPAARRCTWNGAGAWLIFSQSRQVNFSRTCWITFQDLRDHLQRLGDVLAELGQPRAAAAGAGGRSPARSPARAADASGKGLRDGRLRVNDATFVVLAAAISAASSSSVAEASSSASCNSI